MQVAHHTFFPEAGKLAEFVEGNKGAFCFFKFLPDFIQEFPCCAGILNACNKHDILWIDDHTVWYVHRYGCLCILNFERIQVRVNHVYPM